MKLYLQDIEIVLVTRLVKTELKYKNKTHYNQK